MKSKINQSLDGSWKTVIIHDSELGRCEIPSDSSGLKNLIPFCVGEKIFDGAVPGNFEIELEKSGIIKDPFLGKNSLALLEYEDCHVFCGRKFDYSAEEGTKPELIFNGIDTISDIYLNGEKIASTENMFLVNSIPAAGIKNGENDLLVHIKPVCIETRKNKVSAGNSHLRYNYESLRLRKAAHTFGWDIMPRMVSAGIYRSAGIYNRPSESFKQLYIMTKSIDTERKTADMELFFEIDAGREPIHEYSICIEGKCGEKVFSHKDKLWFSSGKTGFKINDALFWQPKGYGDANLYDIKISLFKKENLLDTYGTKLGIRTCKLIRTGTSDMFFSGDFHFEVNGEKIFILGTNWVPLDPLHSRDLKRLPDALKLLEDSGCNMVRCWGGNVYEDPLFYETCDKLGILVWQDFAMACGIYPIDHEFMDVLRDETTEIVRSLRQHPCIVLWAGDNECDQFIHDDPYGRNPNFNRLTREVFPDLLAMEDPTRSYLPSSPYFDTEGAKLPQAYLTENHLWGPRDYYKSDFFRASLSHFASELGYHGCPAKDSLEKFISKEKLWPWQNNEEWRIHASCPESDQNAPYVYRIELMAKQIGELFGKIPEDQDEFIAASQISQAEAKKFFVELFRSSQWKRTGLIWWNLLDGWPQFSDAVVDFYLTKKLAYFYLQQSQKPFILTFTEPFEWYIDLCAINNSGNAVDFSYRVKDYDTGSIVLEGKGRCKNAESKKTEKLRFSFGQKKLYLIEWEAGKNSGKNHYLAGNPPFELSWYTAFLKDHYGDWKKEAKI